MCCRRLHEGSSLLGVTDASCGNTLTDTPHSSTNLGIELTHLILAMLAIALPKLVNLRRVSFAGSNEVASKFAEVLASSHPYLGGLTLQ